MHVRWYVHILAFSVASSFSSCSISSVRLRNLRLFTFSFVLYFDSQLKICWIWFRMRPESSIHCGMGVCERFKFFSDGFHSDCLFVSVLNTILVTVQARTLPHSLTFTQSHPSSSPSFEVIRWTASFSNGMCASVRVYKFNSIGIDCFFFLDILVLSNAKRYLVYRQFTWFEWFEYYFRSILKRRHIISHAFSAPRLQTQ